MTLEQSHTLFLLQEKLKGRPKFENSLGIFATILLLIHFTWLYWENKMFISPFG